VERLLLFALIGCGSGELITLGDGATNSSDASKSGDVDPSTDGSSMFDASDANVGMDGGDETSGNDGAPDVIMPMSVFCGDGIRDPIKEECDDGVVSMVLDSCTSLCEIRDLLAFQSSDAGVNRVLSWGRHPVAANDTGEVVAWLEPNTQAVRVTYYDPKGIPSGFVDTPSTQSPSVDWSGPVAAPLPNGKFAAAYTVYDDGDGAGIGLRYLDPSMASMGKPKIANVTIAFAQFDPDILWTGSQVVVAWVDTSNVQTGLDIRYRTYSGQLVPTSGELTLAGTPVNEADVALATFNND